MQGVVFLGDRQLEIREFPDPTPGPRDVILEMKASGICGTDLHLYRAGEGDAGISIAAEKGSVIAGHEPCGVVVAVGSAVADSEAQIGQRMMNHHYEGCGTCRHCRTGWTQMCGDGATVFGMSGHGGHAQYMKVPAASLIPLDEALSYEVGAAISCGTGTAYSALRRINLLGGETIAIFGQGPVGLSATMLAAAMGARVIAIDMVPARCALALEFGAEIALNANEGDIVEQIMALTQGEGAHKTLDCTSSPEARLTAVRSTRAWGAACMVGIGGHLTVDVNQELIFRQLSVIGSWTFSTTIQNDCANFIIEKDLDIGKIFTDRWDLENAAEAYRRFDLEPSGKGVFLM